VQVAMECLGCMAVGIRLRGMGYHRLGWVARWTEGEVLLVGAMGYWGLWNRFVVVVALCPMVVLYLVVVDLYLVAVAPYLSVAALYLAVVVLYLAAVVLCQAVVGPYLAVVALYLVVAGLYPAVVALYLAVVALYLAVVALYLVELQELAQGHQLLIASSPQPLQFLAV